MIETESQVGREGALREVIPAVVPAQCPVPKGARRWIARFGIVGFAFFAIKGLLWLIIPGTLAWLSTR